jgi:hypothetical protein
MAYVARPVGPPLYPCILIDHGGVDKDTIPFALSTPHTDHVAVNADTPTSHLPVRSWYVS